MLLARQIVFVAHETLKKSSCFRFVLSAIRRCEIAPKKKG